MKRPIRTLPLFLALALFTFACSKEDDGPRYPWRPRPERADQTILFYLGGQSLGGYFKQNIREISQAVDRYVLYDSRILIFVQPNVSPYTHPSLILECSFDYDTQASRIDTLRRYNDVVSTRSGDIARILGEMADLAPARRYGLVLGSHGGGWLPAAYRIIDDFGANAESPFASGVAPNLLHKTPGADATRWFGEDEGEVGEIAAWAEGIAASGVGFDYAIFDACFMSNIESLYDLRHIAPRIVASPCEIMARGIPYHLTLASLLTEEGRSYDLTAFAEQFHDYYLHTTDTRRSGCLAVTRTDELETLAVAMREFNRTITAEPAPFDLQTYEDLHDKKTNEAKPLFFDLRQYIELCEADEAARASLLAQFDRTFPVEGRFHTPSFYSAYSVGGKMHAIEYYSGVTFSGPTRTEAYAAANRETSWYQATH